ncbi:regucalcin-like [Euwallacea fornicatus]|uniref:regucalcin-like n=1 Tax=Euwallacea fornicatus TaxID=995702 RepID=UPI00338DDFBE
MAPKVERINEIPTTELGEGPHWDIFSQSLYFVDIFGKSVHKYIPSSGQHYKASVGKHVSVIVPVKNNPKQFVIGLERDISCITWDGVSQKPEKIEKIAEVDKGTENRMNDGKCDSRGRLFIGTMGPEPVNGQVIPDMGVLYSLDKSKLTEHLTKLGISNGLAWSADSKKFYYTDTFTYRVDQFDYDIQTGSISNRTTIFTPKKHGIEGFPDGMTIDVDGNLWLAIFNGYKVVKFDPRNPETLLEIVEIPAKQVTSVAWGGPELDILYVTTAKFTINGVELLPPLHGATYKVTGLGTRGLPMNSLVL